MLVEKKHVTQNGVNITILEVDGLIKLGESGEFLHHALLIVHKTSKNIVLDFKNIDYIDSTGIGELVGECLKFMKSGKKLVFINTSSRIFELFKLAKADVSSVYSTKEEALASFMNSA